MTRELFTLTMRELSRYEIIKRLLRKEINGTQAAKQLGLSVRQVRNLKRKVRESGARGLMHGNRGRPSNRRISDQVLETASRYLKTLYADFKPTFAKEKLEEHGIFLSKERVRKLMTACRLWKPRERKENGEYRAWRERREYYGQMEQFDGSYHDWFEGRSPTCCLLASIDDATGKITQAEFTSSEGVVPVFSFWKRYVKEKGKPVSVYLDRHSTYKVNTKHLFDDSGVLTQFERVMSMLDIEIIHASSPQAKGRIERLFGTLQDRLVKELRLAGIADSASANQFLKEVFIPAFNVKFAVAPQERGNLHRLLTYQERDQLDSIFSIKSERTVNNDFTVRFEGQWFQLLPSQPTLICRKDKIIVEERLDGSVHLSFRGKCLSYILLSKRPEKVTMRVLALASAKPSWKPPANHPWRRSSSLFFQKRNPQHQTAFVN